VCISYLQQLLCSSILWRWCISEI